MHVTIDLRTESGIDFLTASKRQALQEPLLMNFPRQAADALSAAHSSAQAPVIQLIVETSMSLFFQLGDLSHSQL